KNISEVLEDREKHADAGAAAYEKANVGAAMDELRVEKTNWAFEEKKSV
ncbi:MAG: hypothetical protein GY820_22385, partial [Gammaproteobacteria bacterium]|nr:hypothetical protein [Gammaproteobacteria bacterium]